MTTRTRDRIEPEVFDTIVKTKNGGHFDSKITRMSSSSEVMTDVVTPNFRKRIARGEILNNPCTLVKSSDSAGYGTYHATRSGTVYHASGGSITQYELDIQNRNDLKDHPFLDDYLVEHSVARAKFYALRNIDPTPVAMMEDIAEIRDTFRLLRNPFASLKRLGLSFKKAVDRRVRGGESLTEATANVWLTYRFGFRPLWQSIEDIIENFDKKAKVPSGRLWARGKSQSSKTHSSTPRVHFNGSIYNDYSRVASAEADAHAGILYTVENPVEGFRFKYGLRVKDIPETMWAIVPYSFMIDRVVNVSDGIRALTNLNDPNVKILSAFSRHKYETTNTVTYLSQVNPGWAVTVSGDAFTRKTFVYQRDPWTPTAGDAIPVPEWDGLVSSATNVVDLLALIVGYFKRS